MKVSPSQQVMLKVRFLEASREAGNALGVNWFVFNNKGTRGVVTGIGARRRRRRGQCSQRRQRRRHGGRRRAPEFQR